MPLKGRDTPADRPRNELEEEEEETVQTLQYSQDQVHQSGTALGLMARLVMIVNSDRWRKMAMKTLGVRRPSEGVFLIASRRGIGSVVRESYGGRAAVPSISREGVTQTSCRVTATQSIIKVTEQSACFGHRGVTAFTERRVTGVLDTKN